MNWKKGFWRLSLVTSILLSVTALLICVENVSERYHHYANVRDTENSIGEINTDEFYAKGQEVGLNENAMNEFAASILLYGLNEEKGRQEFFDTGRRLDVSKIRVEALWNALTNPVKSAQKDFQNSLIRLVFFAALLGAIPWILYGTCLFIFRGFTPINPV